jgi:hypothetical protein
MSEGNSSFTDSRLCLPVTYVLRTTDFVRLYIKQYGSLFISSPLAGRIPVGDLDGRVYDYIVTLELAFIVPFLGVVKMVVQSPYSFDSVLYSEISEDDQGVIFQQAAKKAAYEEVNKLTTDRIGQNAKWIPGRVCTGGEVPSGCILSMDEFLSGSFPRAFNPNVDQGDCK